MILFTPNNRFHTKQKGGKMFHCGMGLLWGSSTKQRIVPKHFYYVWKHSCFNECNNEFKLNSIHTVAPSVPAVLFSQWYFNQISVVVSNVSALHNFCIITACMVLMWITVFVNYQSAWQEAYIHTAHSPMFTSHSPGYSPNQRYSVKSF